MADQVTVQVKFVVNTKYGPITDVLIFSPEEYAATTPEGIQLLKQQRVEIMENKYDNATLVQLKSKKYRDLDMWYNDTTRKGITVGTITLAGTKNDQDRYSSLATVEHLALTLGQRQLTDTSGLADVNGDWHAMTVQELFATLLQYSSTLMQLSHQFATLKSTIKAATTKEQVTAITIP